MKYRPEIDGLRALAVLPVILFHAGFNVFSGGYVGVDIFFVISGFLITGIITDELRAGNFSIASFYERRARRILPALFLVLAASIPFAWTLFLPADMQDFSQSVFAVASFASNILFWQESGYFDTATELKPLLHTWSLAVEEQYYIFFPLLLMSVWRWKPRAITPLLVIIGLASLLLAEWGSHHEPTASFYLLPTRGWELLIGSLIALSVERIPRGRNFGEAGAAAGLALILFAIFQFDKNTPFPGLYALAPTLGAGLVIMYARPETITGKILGNKIFVGIGLISYSAYLWHQPLFAFARHYSMAEPSQLMFLALIATTFLLAFLSWKFVEQPFREKNKISKKNITVFSIIGLIFFAAFGFAGHATHGFPFRADQITAKIEQWRSDTNPNSANCHVYKEKFKSPDQGCVNGSGKTSIALLGDSHADALAFALGEAFSLYQKAVKQMTYTGCPPAENIYRLDEDSAHKCYEYNKAVYNYASSDENIDTVILAARWSLYTEGIGFNNKEGGKEFHNMPADIIINGKRLRSPKEKRKEAVLKKYRDAVEHYLATGKKVILVYPIPEVGWEVPVVLGQHFRSDIEKNSMNLSTSYDVYKHRNKEVISMFDSIKGKNLIRIKPDEIFCDTYIKDRCVAAYRDKVFYRDGDHLSKTGAAILANKIAEKFKGSK